MITPEEVVDGLNERYGRHPGHRTLHAKGLFCKGTFIASAEAAGLSRAAHLQGQPAEVTVRFSNGSGDPGSRDYAPDVRGMATSFHLPDGARTDISAQTAPHFPVDTPEGFVEVVKANAGGIARALKIPMFLVRHPSAIPGLRPNLRALAPPESYATRRYFAIHAFKWVNASGGERFVRYTWIPEAGESSISPKEAKERGSDYLQREIEQRLGRGPVHFTLELQLAADRDPTDDPRANWPTDRETVNAGTLELTDLDSSAEADGEPIVFDPTRVTGGVELSDDPILRFRPRAYDVSVKRRS